MNETVRGRNLGNWSRHGKSLNSAILGFTLDENRDCLTDNLIENGFENV